MIGRSVKLSLVFFNFLLLSTCFHVNKYISKGSTSTSITKSLNLGPFPNNYILRDPVTKLSLFNGLKKMVGVSDPAETLIKENEKQIEIYMKKVEKINSLEEIYESYSNEKLKDMTDELRKKLNSGASLDSILCDAFAVVREASWRVLKLRHFDVQLVGGMALHDSRLAEMATGEGKTLVAILPVYLNALSGESAFVVTTNDYLAQRDGENMGQVLKFLGLTVGVVQAYQNSAQRKAAYSCDVTYVSNQELGFDFLRDNLAITIDEVVQTRPYNFCVVDEADSILIDEARTPLIISRKGPAGNEKYNVCAKLVNSLTLGKHYEVNKKDQKVELTPAGYKLAENIVGKGLFELSDPWAFFIINALKAKELFNKGNEYIISDNKVFIVDSFTGRVLEGRRFSDGIQQSIEAKEGLPVSADTQIIAKVTYQSLFRLFPKLSGMTGTAFTEALEFADTYQLKVLPIPTALPIARRDNPDAVFRTKEGKMKALLKNVLNTHDKGRPILIGTTSIESSEEMIAALQDLNINAKLLNARPENVEKESEVVSQAGRLGAVTVATNMAGRGTDILLGGSAKGIARCIAKNLILKSIGKLPNFIELVASSDGQDSSSSSTYLVDDDGQPETDPDVLALPSIKSLCDFLELSLPQPLKPSTELSLKRAVISCSDMLTPTATRLEVEDMIVRASDSLPGSDSNIKRLRSALDLVTAEFEEVLAKEKEEVRRLGGLYVIGTSRHESRRIDNQLRGRAGRQGDQGASRFFLSLEDDLFRVFGGDKMAGLLESFRVAEDMPLESDLVMQALDKVQIQVEDYMRTNRQQVFKLDEVSAGQRAAVYSQRRAFLTSTDEGMLTTFTKFCTKTMEEIYEASLLTTNNKGKPVVGGPVDAQKLVAKAKQFFPNIVLTAEEVASIPPAKVLSYLQQQLVVAVAEKRTDIDRLAGMGGAASANSFVSFFRYLSLVQTDEAWCRHLSRLDLLKEEMVLQSFTADRDVMETYRERALKLFDTLLDTVRRNTVYSLFIYKGTSSSSSSK